MEETKDYRKLCSESLNAIDRDTRNRIVYAYMVGSQNYGLETPTSDIDLKVFTFPTEDSLYKGGLRGESATIVPGPYGQIEIHDYRDIPSLLRKMNPTYLEMFFSKAIFMPESTAVPMINKIKNNLPSLFEQEISVFSDCVRGTIYSRLSVVGKHIKDPNKEDLVRKSFSLFARMICYFENVVLEDPNKTGISEYDAFKTSLELVNTPYFDAARLLKAKDYKDGIEILASHIKIMQGGISPYKFDESKNPKEEALRFFNCYLIPQLINPSRVKESTFTSANDIDKAAYEYFQKRVSISGGYRHEE